MQAYKEALHDVVKSVTAVEMVLTIKGLCEDFSETHVTDELF
jgi:hypothetical protein